MVQQLPRQLDDDQAFNVSIRNMIHESTYLSGEITVHWDSFHANTLTSCVAANAIGNVPIQHLQRDISAPESEALLVRQNLGISETWIKDSMPVNELSSDLRSYCNTAKRRQIAATSSVVVSSSSSRHISQYQQLH
ncbi:hypothetical protein TNCV_1503521 [Trichonephila clavipes]|uniref:Uncharacterized protein n=1 Tax=Trichonephila clavipes TaxID=2585209 RepID=A0A8X6UZH5_TRICX|nr:hypothetical protein TNCV_1503521 [Trichonephila clavipes]